MPTAYATIPFSIPLAAAYFSSSPTARSNAESIPSAPRNEMMTIMILVVSNWTIVRSESLVVLPNGAKLIGKHRQPLDLDFAPANARVDFAGLPDTEYDRRLHPIQVERARRVERFQGDQVVDVHDGIDPVQVLPLA